MPDIADLTFRAHMNSLKHGFWDDCPVFNPRTEGENTALATYYGNKLMLTVGEVAEAHEELRTNSDAHHFYYRADGKPEGVQFELADIVVRVMDLAGAIGIDLEAAIVEKMEYNEGRPAMHGKNF